MTDPDARPNPDSLLVRVNRQAAREKRAKLRIFLGFAPGVGKTYRMLSVARDLIDTHRKDVVVGVVETHRRSDTAAMTIGLELLPPRKVVHREQTLKEFDLDRAIARHPSIILLDELAHTNAPGSRHPKRWQDALELLDHGIDVFTTVNVQHIESLNDVIAQITHIRVRETIPDSILDRADELELVDIAPEELLQRLGEGKVYLPEEAKRAASHFFKRGNLLALRELALRHMAQHVDEDVLEYREEHGVVDTWAAGERILVCIGPAPSSGRLIRAAHRMATGLRAPWSAVYVESAALGGMTEHVRDRLESHFRLAESLGGNVKRLSGERVSSALLNHARKYNFTRIVIGKPTHSRLRDRLRGSLLDEIVRGSGDIDVHVIRGDEGVEKPRVESDRVAPVRWDAYGKAAMLILAATALALAVRSVFPLPDLIVIHLLAVMLAAIKYGRGPSVAAAALSVAAYDFFFVPPFYTFAVSDGRYILTFAMMFGVGLVVSELTARIRRQEHDALAREARTAALYALSRELGAAEDVTQASSAVARHAGTVFDGEAFVLMGVQGSEELSTVASFPEEARLEHKDRVVAKWTFDHGKVAGIGTDTLPGAAVFAAPLESPRGANAVLAVRPREGAPIRTEQREFLDGLCRQAALALERLRLAEEAGAAALRAKTEEMRSALLSAVSHDLRTPLAAITGASTSLRDDKGLDETVRADLLDAICSEAERLERLVSNLLDMTRLSSGAVTLKREWVPLDEIVSSALARLDKVLGARVVRTDLAPDLPLLSVDAVLFEQLFINLLENAVKYTPQGSPIEIAAKASDREVSIEVRDRGPGLPLAARELAFERFYRGAHVGVPGVGLGLSICRAIAQVHGGIIRAEDRPGGGAIFRITLPLPEGAPTMALEGEEGALS
ncbi:MAG: sensor histidine kinase KdpD [Polyangiaceae bacterium]